MGFITRLLNLLKLRKKQTTLEGSAFDKQIFRKNDGELKTLNPNRESSNKQGA